MKRGSGKAPLSSMDGENPEGGVLKWSCPLRKTRGGEESQGGVSGPWAENGSGMAGAEGTVAAVLRDSTGHGCRERQGADDGLMRNVISGYLTSRAKKKKIDSLKLLS